MVDKEYIAELIERLDIEEKKEQLICGYSKGMKQKISIISALVHRPSVLVLDEPFAGLDPLAIREMKKILEEFSELGNVIIFSTHDLDVADTICTDAVLISGGKVVSVENKIQTNGQKFEENYFKYVKKKELHEKANLRI